MFGLLTECFIWRISQWVTWVDGIICDFKAMVTISNDQIRIDERYVCRSRLKFERRSVTITNWQIWKRIPTVVDELCAPDIESIVVAKSFSWTKVIVVLHFKPDNSKSDHLHNTYHGPLARYAIYGLHMRRECRERFPSHRGLVIPACITARA